MSESLVERVARIRAEAAHFNYEEVIVVEEDRRAARAIIEEVAATIYEADAADPNRFTSAVELADWLRAQAREDG